MTSESPEKAPKPCTLTRQLVEVVIGMGVALVLAEFVFGLNKAPSAIIAYFLVFLLTGACLLVVHLVAVLIWPCKDVKKRGAAGGNSDSGSSTSGKL